jgi:threonine 3-dehydrogenase
MKCLAKITNSKGLILSNFEEPKIEFMDDVIVNVLGASICGTDLHIYEWDDWAKNRIKPPLIVGHEMMGKVVEVGSYVKNVKIGDIVVGESHIPCLTCYNCRTGKMHICLNLKVLGVDINGCFAEYCKTKEISLWKIGDYIEKQYASALEPLGNAIHAIFEANVNGKDITVFGCGPIGLATIFMAKKLGAINIIAVDISEYRMKMAYKMGADTVLDARDKKLKEEILKSTNGIGVDVFFEMSGAQSAYNIGLETLKSSGLAILFGLPSKEISLNVADRIIFKEIRLKGIFGRKIYDTWYKLEKFLKKYGFPFQDFITHRFKIDNFEEAFETLKSGNCGKILLSF